MLREELLDPYPFWNFAGNTKCAGCDAIYAMKFVNGQLVSGPTPGTGKADLLPDTRGQERRRDRRRREGSERPQARPDPFSGKQKHVTKSLRGKPTSGSPLKKEDLVGSKARFIAELYKG